MPDWFIMPSNKNSTNKKFIDCLIKLKTALISNQFVHLRHLSVKMVAEFFNLLTPIGKHFPSILLFTRDWTIRARIVKARYNNIVVFEQIILPFFRILVVEKRDLQPDT